MEVIILLIVSLALLAWFEIYNIRFGHSTNDIEQKKWDKYRHILKGALQLSILSTIAIINFKIAIVVAILYWILHDISINLGNGWNWLYLGNTSLIDKGLKLLGNKGAFIFKIVLLLGSILFYIKGDM